MGGDTCAGELTGGEAAVAAASLTEVSIFFDAFSLILSMSAVLGNCVSSEELARFVTAAEATLARSSLFFAAISLNLSTEAVWEVCGSSEELA